MSKERLDLSPPIGVNQIVDKLPKKKRVNKQEKSEAELVQFFWQAPMEAFFGQETIAPVINSSVKTLECNRWRGRGIPYRKTETGKVLYRKSDVVSWLEGQKLVCSTSEYEYEVRHD